jgi:hypothetical protein
LSSLRSISSSHILGSRSIRCLANSWETSRRAIRPCTASSVLCGLAVSISRALCSAIRWFLSMMPLCVQLLGAYRLTFPKIHSRHTAGLLTTLCLKPQVIAMRQTRSYIPSPADDAPSPRPRYAGRRAYRSVPGPCEIQRSSHTEAGSTDRPLPAEVPTPEPPGAGSRRSSL